MRLFLMLLAAHIVADWFLQNDWMANNKTKLTHWASLVHAYIHFMCVFLVILLFIDIDPDTRIFITGVITFTHYLIDLRFALVWWRKFFKMTTEGPVALHVAIWQDQMAHLLVIIIISLVFG